MIYYEHNQEISYVRIGVLFNIVRANVCSCVDQHGTYYVTLRSNRDDIWYPRSSNLCIRCWLDAQGNGWSGFMGVSAVVMNTHLTFIRALLCRTLLVESSLAISIFWAGDTALQIWSRPNRVIYRFGSISPPTGISFVYLHLCSVEFREQTLYCM